MTQSTSSETVHPDRLPYVTPVLKRYGDLAHLTQQKGMGGHASDGALAHNNKTR